MSPIFDKLTQGGITKNERQTMNTYSDELKSSVIAKMLPPHNRSVPDLAKETNIPLNTLYTWCSRHVLGGETFTTASNTPSSTEKFQAVLATATLSEIDVGQYKLDKNGHLIVDHDLHNYDGELPDGIAEAFIDWAKSEKLSFWN
jgi:transposase-like protein